MLAGRSTESDESLVLAWRAGNRSAGAEVFLRYEPTVRRFLERRLGRDSGDEIQDVWAALAAGIHRFEGRSTFRTFMFALANNHVREVFRRRKRCRRVGALIGDVPDERRRAAPEVCESMRAAEALAAGLSRLPPALQHLVAQYYFEGRTAGEIGRLHEIPEDTARSRLRRAKALLRTYLSTPRSLVVPHSGHGPIASWLGTLHSPTTGPPRSAA